MSTIKIEKLNKIYDNGFHAVHDFNLDIKDGEFIILVGPSGCGKSTTLRMIAGIEAISSGVLDIDGKICNNLKPRDRGIAMVFQSYALYPTMSVYDNLAFSLRIAGYDEDEIEVRVDEVANILGIQDYLARKPKNLSGGQRQRVAIARALIKNSPIVILDEATSALDNESEAIVQKALDNLMQNRTVFVIAHRLSTIHNADRIAVLNEGELVELGSHDELINKQGGRYKHLYEMQFNTNNA